MCIFYLRLFNIPKTDMHTKYCVSFILAHTYMLFILFVAFATCPDWYNGYIIIIFPLLRLICNCYQLILPNQRYRLPVIFAVHLWPFRILGLIYPRCPPTISGQTLSFSCFKTIETDITKNIIYISSKCSGLYNHHKIYISRIFTN